MSDPTSDAFLMLDLLPHGDTKAASVDETWTTAMGNPNRIAIGKPRWTRETEPGQAGMLEPSDLETYSLDRHVFQRLAMDLTLLPATNCRFTAVDFLVNLLPSGDSLPLVLRLSPAEKINKHVLVEEVSAGPKIELAEPAFRAVKVGLGATAKRREEIERISVSLGSFGVSTQEAGWRFSLTKTEDIPITACDLQALIVTDPETENSVSLNVIAHIEVRSTMDRWLSRVFKRDDGAKAQCLLPVPA